MLLPLGGGMLALIDISFGNSLLRRLSGNDLKKLGQLEHVHLDLRQTLETANNASEHVYFIEDGLASVVSSDAAGAATEIGIIGREGMTGLGLVYGDRQSPFETFMQIEGAATRCQTAAVRDLLTTSETARSLFAAYARAFSIQVATTAVANGRSKLEERLARWLLMVGDRVGPHFHITHEFMAVMLAVRRSGVTLAVQSLEGRGLIKASRGTINIVDRTGLIQISNGAYGLAEREYGRLVGEF